MKMIIFVGIGGFLGAIMRFLLSAYVQKSVIGFPVGTLSVNLLGSFLIGFLALFFEQHVAAEYRALVITGFLGALTTFSTFSYESVMLLEQGAWLKAMVSIVLNITLAICATFFGMWIFKKFFLNMA